MLDHVRQTHEAEKAFHHEQVRALQLESNDLTGKLDRLTDLLIEGHITPEVYERKHMEITHRRTDIDHTVTESNLGDTQFKTALLTLLKIVAKAPELFESSKPEEKRQLISFVFSNLKLEGATLRYTLRKPFDMFVNLSTNPEWRPLRPLYQCF
jgi:hypothetical protein